MSSDGLVVIGRVQKPFGVRGEIRVQAYTETFEAFEKSEWLLIKDSRLNIKQIRIHKGSVLVLFDGIETPEQASAYSGQLVRTLQRNLPAKDEDEYYYFELIGLNVFICNGGLLGRITGIMPTGANDVLVVFGDAGEILIPFIDEVVIEIDLNAGKMVIDPMEGLIPKCLMLGS